MAGGECHMMIGLCEVNLGGCHEDESSEPMPALTLGQGVEQNSQRVIRNSTNDKIGNWTTGVQQVSPEEWRVARKSGEWRVVSGQ
jgi:hypothetical protein